MLEIIPPDFEPVTFDVPFLHLIGPFYRRINDPSNHLGMLVEKRHCNTVGVAHGGVLVTLADVAAARGLIARRGLHLRALTISLNSDFVATAPLGAWLEAHLQIKKEEGGVGFATCEIRHGDRVIVVASGAFRFITPR